MDKKDRLDKKTFFYGKHDVLKYKHLCKDCKTEIWLNPHEERNATGYCKKCIYKHKRKRKGSVFNEKGEKLCKWCNRFLSTDKFLKRGKVLNGFATPCSKCANLKKFNINSIQFEEMVAKQDNKCAICNNPEQAFDKVKGGIRDLAVDHDHETNKVRGLLCTKCNVSIGHFREDVSILEKAILYLKLYKIY